MIYEIFADVDTVICPFGTQKPLYIDEVGRAKCFPNFFVGNLEVLVL